MLRKPTFSQVLSFNAVELNSDILTLCQGAVPLEAPHRLTKDEATKSGILQAGLFGGNEARPTPDATKKDVQINPEDIVSVPFRFISAAIVGGTSWKASDFRTPGVLKASIPLLDKTPIFSDHNTDAGNWAGIVTEPTWQEEITYSGDKIPAGINGKANIDSKSQFTLARGILMGAINSNSVTTQFKWEPSHSFETMDAFYNSIGSFNDNGEMITRKVLEIQDYFESSMLFAGADPFAKKLDPNGKPIRVDRTSVYFSKANPIEKTKYDEEKKFIVVAENNKELISLSQATKKPGTGNNTPTEQKNAPMKNLFLLAFVKHFGKDLGLTFSATSDEMEFTEAQVTEVTTAMAKLGMAKSENAEATKALTFSKGLQFANDKGELSAFDVATANGEYVVMQKTAFTGHTKVVTDLTKERDDLKPVAAIGNSFIEAKRAEVIRLGKLAQGDKFDAAMEANVKTATPEALDSFLKQYGGEVGVKFAATCTKCNSGENVEMRSSFVGNNGGRDSGTAEELDFSDIDDTNLFIRNRKPAKEAAE